MSPTLAPPARERSTPSMARRAQHQRRTSLFTRGEPMVWLTGGALAICLAMILGMLALVLWQGASTFWPGEVVEVRARGGRTFLGEVAAEETYRPEAHAFESLGDGALAASQAVERAGGEARRRMLRTENFELTGTHYHWVSDFEIEGEERPPWAVVFERRENGRFYGVPRALEVDGKVVAAGPEQVWRAYRERRAEIAARHDQAEHLREVEIGRINRRLESARLAVRGAELEAGADSPRARAAQQGYERVQGEVEGGFAQLRRQIQELEQENARTVMKVTTASGQEHDLPLASIVRAYPPNRLNAWQKAGVYASRVREFVFDKPRESNTEGGVMPAIFGTVAMTLIMALLVAPFGVMAALYLREYAKPGPVVSFVRIAINNLAGVPSIVFGVFGLGFFCYIIGSSIDRVFFATTLPTPTFGTGGVLWASLTLALLTLPVVIVPTEEALAAVPGSMREGSYACGATKWQTIRRIVLPRAMPGIMTGMILAIARGAGEVAPLMLVGAVKLAPELPIDGQAPFVHASRSFMHLGFHIYDLGFQSPNSEAAKPMVYTTTLLLIALVVLLNVVAIWIRARLRRRFQGAQV